VRETEHRELTHEHLMSECVLHIVEGEPVEIDDRGRERRFRSERQWKLGTLPGNPRFAVRTRICSA